MKKVRFGWPKARPNLSFFTKQTPNLGYNQGCADPDPDPCFFGQKDPDP